MLLTDAHVDGRLVDIRIADGRIVEVGPVLDRIGADLVPLHGRVVVPGLWDEHVHLTQWAVSRSRLDLSTAHSAAAAAELVRHAPAPASGLPLVGVAFRDGLWPDAPSVALLDAARSGVPVVLVSGDLHCCWLNTAARERFGVSPDAGPLLREADCFAVTAKLDDAPDAVVDGWVRDALAVAASRGVVGVVDLEMRWNHEVWARRAAGGIDAVRVEFGVYPQHLDRAIAEGLRSGLALTDTVSVGPFKVVTDGSLNTRTAYCVDPYPGTDPADPTSRGLLTVPTDDLVDWLRRATSAGFVPAVHAIGDAANSLALDAFAAVGVGGRIEHAQLLSHDDLARFAELGIVASVQPEHAMDDRDVADVHWHGRTDRSFVLRSLLDAGARLRLGSDAPVAPLDPWVAIAAAVGRARDGRAPWHPEQAITLDEAIGASTRTTVAAGEPADLAVLDLEPGDLAAASLDVDRLRRTPVALTLLGGRVTHDAR